MFFRAVPSTSSTTYGVVQSEFRGWYAIVRHTHNRVFDIDDRTMLSWIPVFFCIPKIPYFLDGQFMANPTRSRRIFYRPTKVGFRGVGGVGWGIDIYVQVMFMYSCMFIHDTSGMSPGTGWAGEVKAGFHRILRLNAKARTCAFLEIHPVEVGEWPRKPLEEDMHGLETDDGMTRCEAKQS